MNDVERLGLLLKRRGWKSALSENPAEIPPLVFGGNVLRWTADQALRVQAAGRAGRLPLQRDRHC